MRIRRGRKAWWVCGWVAAGVAVLAAGAFAASSVWTVVRMGPYGKCHAIKCGNYSWLSSSAQWEKEFPEGAKIPWQWASGRRSIPMEWLPRPYTVGYNGRIVIQIPLWAAALLAGTSAAALLIFTRAVPPHCCSTCQYDLRGTIAGAPCPECGVIPAGSDGQS